MRASLYEALGIPPTASDEEVRAALRRLIRKYYAKTRDGQGNVEEALRFINHASRILSDPDRRIRYNGELARSGDPVPPPVPHVAINAMAASGEGTDVAPTRRRFGGRARSPSRPATTRAISRATSIIRASPNPSRRSAGPAS